MIRESGVVSCCCCCCCCTSQEVRHDLVVWAFCPEISKGMEREKKKVGKVGKKWAKSGQKVCERNTWRKRTGSGPPPLAVAVSTQLGLSGDFLLLFQYCPPLALWRYPRGGFWRKREEKLVVPTGEWPESMAGEEEGENTKTGKKENARKITKN